MSKKSVLLAVISSLVLLLSCSSDESQAPANPAENPDNIIQLDNDSTGPKGKLKLNIYEEQSKHKTSYNNNIALRTALPDIDMTIDSFRITGSCSDGSSFSLITSLNSIEIRNMSVGRWIIRIDSLNSDKTGIGFGQGSVDVLENETSQLLIGVSPYTGFGIIQITVKWDADLENPSIEGKITRYNSTVFDLHFEISGNTATTEVVGAAGYYLLSVNLYDAAGEVHPYVGGAVEVVRIVEDEITPGVFYINANSEYGYGDLEINVDVDMNDPIDIELAGQVAMYNIGDTMTVTASSPGETETIEYTWYLNGELVAIDDEYTTSSTLPAGPYRLDVTAFNESGDRAGSVTYHFQILIAGPSDLSYSENPAVYTVGIPITDNIATVTGEGCTYSVFPDLPQGLILNESTGAISGTPETAQIETTHTVYAENYGGSTSVDLYIAVNYEIPSLSVTGTGEDHVNLSWTYNYPFISGYEVYRTTTQGVYDYNSPITVITSTNTTEAYTDYSVDPDTTYYYVVRGFYGFEYSQDSNEVSATTQSVIQPDELVAHWKLEGDALDSAGENHGTLYGSPLPTYAEGVKGLPNTCISLNGANQYVAADNTGQLTNNITSIAFWMRPTSTNSGTIIDHSLGNQTGWKIRQHTNNERISVHYYGANPGDTYEVNWSGLALLNEWTHVMVTIDGEESEIKLYINGSQYGSTQSMTGTFAPCTGDLFIGRGYYGSDYFQGSVSDVRIYNYEISETDAPVLYNSLGKITGYWKLDGNANDSGPFNQDGTEYGNPSYAEGIGGLPDTAIELNGIDQYINFGNSANINLSNQTISFWLYAEQGNLAKPILWKINNQNGWRLSYFDLFHGYRFEHRNNYNSAYTYSTFSCIEEEWHHITMVINNDNHEINWFLNGIKLGNTVDYTESYGLDETNTLYLGTDSNQNNFFNGRISNLQIFNYLLSDSQVSELYNSY